MLNQITESFFSKLMEKLVEYVFDTFLDKKNLESTLEDMKNNLNSLSGKAFDVEETIKKEELFGKKKRKREVKEWLRNVKIIKKKLHKLESEIQTQGSLRNFLNGDQATQLNARIHKLVEQSQQFGELLVDVLETRGEALLTTNLCGKGFKENLKRIWNLLTSENVLSIGIYGMGGVGKTALARHINNIILEKRKEKCVCWITVSQAFSIKTLQDEIARSIDDVWENICLDKLGDPLRLEGCRLILVTRLLEVCCQMGCQERIKVEKLQKDESWNLFKQKLGQDIALVPRVEELAKSMVKVCDGLPLGIIVLAGSMRGETSIHAWQDALENLRDPNMVQDDKQEEFFKILKHSFDRLHSNHQLCFLHCSLYPEDFKIHKEALVERFISEEIVDRKKSRQSQLDHGYVILNKLVNVCLLESVDEDWVKMHDLVRVMALKITKRKNMVISGIYSLKEIPNDGEWMTDLEKISLMNNGIMEIPDGISPDCPNLTTLILHWNPLRFISDSFFSQLCNMCYLDLSQTNIEKLPNSFSNLENLKALNLGFCKKLVDIPYLGKLKKLKELHLSGTAIKNVPEGMEQLVDLRCLSLNATKFLDILPKGLLLNFPRLQCLRLPYQIKAPMEEIARLKHVEEFWGRAKSVSAFNEYITSRHSQLSTIFYIIMVYEGIYKDFKPFFIGKQNRRNKLNVRQCDLKGGLEEDSTMLVHDIQFLKLEECEGLSSSLLDDFPRLSNPDSLEILEISKCGEIECILTNEQFFMAGQEFESRFDPLRTLEEIVLSELQNFIGVIQNIGVAVKPPLFQVSVFSSLRSLDITHCNKMRKLGLPLSKFQNLEGICIRYYDEIEEIIEVREGEGGVVTLQKLKELRLSDLPRLKRICNTTMSCGSIKIIELKRCLELKKLPLYFDPSSYSPPRSLKHIFVGEGDKEWWESLEWENPNHNHLLQPLVKFVDCMVDII
ncbi:Apoptotic ATPase [Handroanthus impetiginosus]|uniref:Apoptotic ATPase n=1 Tax=Handroanthus impetiginosus TaxID=429701 RepID=A0A2G9HRU5_9LAMI|nr:Apoptotic ATPase [Handroanthus impetiginosus]